jgi:hypothetical protein
VEDLRGTTSTPHDVSASVELAPMSDPGSKSGDEKPRSGASGRRTAMWVSAIALGACMLMVLARWRFIDDDIVSAHGRPPDSPADELREQASSECQRELWRQCLDHLDEAKRLDPGGDEKPSVREQRRRATVGLAVEAGATR